MGRKLWMVVGGDGGDIDSTTMTKGANALDETKDKKVL
jgi:hypothetical protein